MNFKKEAVIAFAGPAANFLAAGLSFIFQIILSRKILPFTVINFVLGTLNLSVCEPLDGYRTARYVLLQKTSEEKTEKILKITSLVFLFFIAAAGFVVLIKSGYNISLLLIAAYLCTFLFVRTKAV